MRASLFVLSLFALAPCGCGSNSAQPAAAAPVPVPVPAGPMFDTLEYANWKKFPVGTTVKRRASTCGKDGKVAVVSVETFTLKALTADEVEVVRQNTTERTDGSYKSVNPEGTLRFKRQFAIPNGMTAADFNKPSRKAKSGADEELIVLGKKYAAATFTWADATEAGPLEIKVWLSDEVPGRVLKQVMTQNALGNTTTDEVIELKVP